MNQTIRIVQLILLFLIASYGTSIEVLYSSSADLSITNGIVTELRKNGSAESHLIRSTYDISKALSHKPEILLLVSDSAISTYLRFAPKKDTLTKIIALCSYDSYHSLKAKLPKAQFCVSGIATDELYRQLSKFTRTIYPTAGFLYYNAVKQEISYEMATIRQSGISPFTRAIPDSATADQLKRALNLLSEQGVTTIRIAVSDSTYALLTNNDELKQLLEKLFSVILTDRPDLHTFLPQTPTLTITSDDKLYCKSVALLATALRYNEKSSEDITISTETGTLHYGTDREEQLTESRTILVEQIDSLIRSAGKKSRGDVLTESVLRTLNPISKSGVVTATEQIVQMAEAGTGLDKKLILSITIRDLMIFFSSLTLIGVAINILYKLIEPLLSHKPIATIYPNRSIATKIERENKRPKRLERILRSERFTVKPISSLMQYRTFLKKKTADLHIIEWTNGSDVVIYLQHIFDQRNNKRTEPVVIFNISKKFQIELAPRFSKTPLFMFESTPTLEDLERVFYGSGHQEYHVSSIAGELAQESLPQILQTLESSCLTGALLIEDPEPFSIIFYMNGLIVYAQDRFGSSIEDTLYQTLEKRDGSFRFEKNRRAPFQKIALNSMDVLMSWSLQSDGIPSE